MKPFSPDTRPSLGAVAAAGLALLAVTAAADAAPDESAPALDATQIVDREVGPHAHPPEAWELVRRLIHATADFEFRDLTVFSPDALAAAKFAVRRGAPVVADVKMIAIGDT